MISARELSIQCSRWSFPKQQRPCPGFHLFLSIHFDMSPEGALDHSLRQDFLPDDVTLAFAGAVYAVVTSPDRQQIERVLDLLAAGLRSSR